MVLQNSHRVSYGLWIDQVAGNVLWNTNPQCSTWVAWMIDSDHLRRTSITDDWLGTMFDPSEKNMKKMCLFLFAMYRNNFGFYWTETRSNCFNSSYLFIWWSCSYFTRFHGGTHNFSTPFSNIEPADFALLGFRTPRAQCLDLEKSPNAPRNSHLNGCGFLLWRDEMCWLQ